MARLWSIPACTGNPCRSVRCRSDFRVYPRVYGESDGFRTGDYGVGGLSPRVRGIRSSGAQPVGVAGSIPACTGNPSRKARRPWMVWVYPRVYGESWQRQTATSRSRGLSPRVRGIQRHRHEREAPAGSIPACTGNPQLRAVVGHAERVYPRVYGESDQGRAPGGRGAGLSPRVRGIRLPRPTGR